MLFTCYDAACFHFDASANTGRWSPPARRTPTSEGTVRGDRPGDRSPAQGLRAVLEQGSACQVSRSHPHARQQIAFGDIELLQALRAGDDQRSLADQLREKLLLIRVSCAACLRRQENALRGRGTGCARLHASAGGGADSAAGGQRVHARELQGRSRIVQCSFFGNSSIAASIKAFACFGVSRSASNLRVASIATSTARARTSTTAAFSA